MKIPTTLLVGALALSSSATAQILFIDSYFQDFNTLPTSSTAHVPYNDAAAPTWTDNVTLPGWYASANVTDEMYITNGSTQPVPGNHLSMASMGPADDGDRALGMVRRSTSGFFGVQFINSSESTITELDVSFRGEQWRSSLSDVTMNFSYAVGATSVDGAGFTEVPELAFVAPNPNNGIVDGNSAAGSVALAHTLTGLNIAPGAEFWFRWTDSANNNTMVAIDDLTVAIPEPSTYALIGGIAALGLVMLRRRRKA